MKVLLKRNWFSPEGQRFKKSTPKTMPVDVPDHLRAFLPSDVEIVGEDYVAPEPIAGPQTLSEAAQLTGADLARTSAEAIAAVANPVAPTVAQAEPLIKRGPGRPRKIKE